MAGFELAGTALKVGDVQTYGTFSKRELIVKVEDGQYPQEIAVEFCQDKMSLLDPVSEGDAVELSFNLRGREHGGRWYNSVQGWRLKSTGTSAPTAPPPADGAPADFEEYEDSIPF